MQNKLEKVDQVITDTPAFQILNEAMKGMQHVVIFLTTYSFHGHQKFTNSCNWQCSKLFIACQINLNRITCNPFLFSFTIYIKTLIIRVRNKDIWWKHTCNEGMLRKVNWCNNWCNVSRKIKVHIHMVLKFEKIWLSITFIFIQKSLKSLSFQRKRAIIHER